MNTLSPHGDKRRWWLPSISLWIWLAFFLGLTLSNWRQVLISADGDACMHRRIGDWMIEHRVVLHADPFSYTRPGAPVMTMEWGSELMMAVAARLLGWNGIVVWAAALIATAVWLLHRELLSEGVDLLLATALVLLAAMASSMHWLARPHIVSFPLLVVWTWQLRQFHQGRLNARTLLLRLIPLMAFWVNLHPGAFTGITLVGVYLIGQCPGLLAGADERRLASRKMITLGALGLSCVLVSLLNPNGWKLHAYIAEFLRHPALVTLVNEFRSPDFHSAGARGFLLLLLVLVTLLTAVRPRLSFVEILLIGWAGYSALYWVRNIPAFAVIVTPILAEHLNAFLRSAPETAWTKIYRSISLRSAPLDRAADGRVIAAVAVVTLLCVMVMPKVCGSRALIETEILSNRFPVAAVQFVRGNPRMVSGEMFNSYGWGGYLILYLPERRVFMDGRNDFYGEELIDEFNKPDEVKPGWEDVFAKYHVGWTILPRTHPLCSLLALRTDWKRVYQDEVTAIYTRQPGKT